MPELPEVETLRRDLAPHLEGARICQVKVLWPRSISCPSPADFAVALQGRRIASLARRGKYLLLHLEGGDALIFHLGMSGRLLLGQSGGGVGKYTRLLLELEGGRRLSFDDLRKFGRVYLVKEAQEVVGKLGPEPLDEGFSHQQLYSLFAGRKTRLKPLLLDQRVLAGLGNIYADEALFRAGLHPSCRACDLEEGEMARLCEASREALMGGIENRGTSLSDGAYRDAQGQEGNNQGFLLVHGREGEPCPQCGTPIERIRLGGRSTYFCPACQKPKEAIR